MIRAVIHKAHFGVFEPKERPYIGWADVEADIVCDGRVVGDCVVGFYVRLDGTVEPYGTDEDHVYYSVEGAAERRLLEEWIGEGHPVERLLALIDADLPPDDKLYRQFLRAFADHVKERVLDDWKKCRTPEEAIRKLGIFL